MECSLNFGCRQIADRTITVWLARRMRIWLLAVYRLPQPQAVCGNYVDWSIPAPRCLMAATIQLWEPTDRPPQFTGAICLLPSTATHSAR